MTPEKTEGKSQYPYYTVLSHCKVAFCSMQASTLFFLLFWPTILCTAEDISHPLSHKKNTHRWSHSFDFTFMLQIVTGHMTKRVQGAMLCHVSIHPIACIPHATVHTFYWQLQCVLKVKRFQVCDFKHSQSLKIKSKRKYWENINEAWLELVGEMVVVVCVYVCVGGYVCLFLL